MDLSRRTFDYAVAVARFARSLPDDLLMRHAAGQLIRSSSSVAANYRAAGLARSRREFIAKLGLVIEEADECVFWLDYLKATAHAVAGDLVSIRREGQELLWIMIAARKTARANAPSRV